MHEYVVQPCYLSLTFGMIFLPDNLVGGQIEHLFKLFPAGSRGNRKSLVSEGYRSLWAETGEIIILKETLSRSFDIFFYESNPQGPLTNRLKWFCNKFVFVNIGGISTLCSVLVAESKLLDKIAK